MKPFSLYQTATTTLQAWGALLLLLLFLPFFANAQQHTLSHKLAPEEIAKTMTFDIIEDRYGFIWYAGRGGLHRYDGLHTEVFTEIVNDTLQRGLGLVYVLLEDSRNRIWVGSYEGLFCYDRESGRLVKKFTNVLVNHANHSSKVLALYEDRSGRLWIGGEDRLFVLTDIEGDEIKEVTGIEIFKAFQLRSGIRSIKETATGQLFAATTNGLLEIKSDYTFSQYQPGSVKIGKEPFIIVDSEISGDSLWLATNVGLWLFKTSEKQFYEITLPGNSGKLVRELLLDGADRLLIATEKDIWEYSRERVRQLISFKDCTVCAGINDFEKDKAGTIWIGGNSGFGRLEKETQDAMPPKVYLTHFGVFNAERKFGKANELVREISLPLEENSIAFEFSSIHFDQPERIKFRHKLEGFENEWVETGSFERKVTYTNLPPGTYRFKVIAANAGGNWTNEAEGLTIKLSIIPPWYRTNLAYVIYLFIFTGVLFGLRRYELRRQLAQAEARHFKELDAVKTRLYTNITHEFRTPLTVILGMEEQLRKNPDKWLAEGLRLIRRNGKQLLNLVNQLLDLSKLESGHMPLNLVQGDIISYLYYLIESFHSYADSKDIRLHFRPDVSELHMDYDPEKLQNVISNLLSNAIKFTPAGGDVYVDLRIANYDLRFGGQGADSIANRTSAIEIQVADNGPGVAPEHLPHIFDRFYQADDSNTRRGEGTGIGLALARELVRAMSGTVGVESTVGKGTKFSIRLPVAQTAPKSDDVPLPEGLEEIYSGGEVVGISNVQSSDRYSVLLVEDNPDVIAYLSSVLHLHYRIETARNGQEGIDKALDLVPDVIVSDVMMPEKDGFELCQVLKIDERTSHIPIILLTAKADQKSKIEGLTHGADAYLAKPFDREELLVRLEKLIELRRRMQARFQHAGGLRQALIGKAQTVDELFLQKVSKMVEAQMANEYFGMPELCKALSMSRSNLFRKLKALTGKSVTVFIRTIRLEKAKELLETTEMNVSEVCFAVGFNSPNYFSKVFQEEFGVAPRAVRRG